MYAGPLMGRLPLQEGRLRVIRAAGNRKSLFILKGTAD